MTKEKILYHTQSLCPVCLEKIDAAIVSNGKGYRMKKTCPDHGAFEASVWKGNIPMEDWKLEKNRAFIKSPLTGIEKGCPYDCGLCKDHRQHTCTALIEVTKRCNLNCRFCFADSNAGCTEDPSIDRINWLYKTVLESSGLCNIQLSGGEPTMRDDLPVIIRNGKELGFEFIQINTNGIRIAKDEEYTEELKSAGLDSLFLQFDGTDDVIYWKLRGRDLLALKIKAIENCKKYGIGVVLVPTLVPDTNVDNIGKIIDFALEHIQVVREVHFQPVSYFGRIPHPPADHDRITLPELMEEIEKQTNSRIKAESFRLPQCENSFCSFHGRYLYEGNLKLTALAPETYGCAPKADKEQEACGCVPKAEEEPKTCCCCALDAEEGAVKAKAYVSKNWSSRESAPWCVKTADGTWDGILDHIRSNSFAISAMAFQDVWNVDLERVKDCCIHVVSPEGKLIPFCLYNLTDTHGRALYRKF